MTKTVVVALGGNAILRPSQEGRIDEQLANVKDTMQQVADLIALGYRVIITHGNGPQVGAILLQNDAGRNQVPAMPLDVCGAMSQGMLGYVIQGRLEAALRARGIDLPVATVITQTRVDPKDPAFDDPTKPIGPFYSEEEAQSRMAGGKETWIDDAGRGWRRVVASPDPEQIVESEAIRSLIDSGTVVICVGGGGIPVVEDGDDGDDGYRGVEAVIDKDLASERLAVELQADILLILTDVPCVMLDYGTDMPRPLRKLPPAEARQYLDDGQFGVGSMAPKVEACIRFVEAGGEEAIITSLTCPVAGIRGDIGTRIVR